MASEIKLFYADGACSLAPHIVLEEIGIPFEPVPIDTKNGQQRTADYLRINPKARVPALAVDGWILTENPAILQFLALSFPAARLWPDDPREQARVSEWLAWLASTVHVAYAHLRRAERYATAEAALEDVRAKGRESCRDLWRAVEARLGRGPWAVGERYTVADAYLMVFWNWGRGPALGLDMERDHPNWTAHARRVARRPAVLRAFRRETLEPPVEAPE